VCVVCVCFSRRTIVYCCLKIKINRSQQTSANMTDAKVSKGPWLHAWYDPLAGIKTVTPLVRMADLNSVGQFANNSYILLMLNVSF
jgi:hypothetical protein